MEISYPRAGILAVLAVLATCVLRTLHAPVIHTEDKLPDAPDGLMLLVADECLGAWGAEAMLAASRVFVQAGATLVLACRYILVHSGASMRLCTHRHCMAKKRGIHSSWT